MKTRIPHTRKSLLLCLSAMLLVGAGCSEPISLSWEYKGSEPMWSTPLVLESGESGLLLVGDEAGYLNALDLETGNQKWRFATLQDVYSSPAKSQDGKRVLFGSTNYFFYCLDAEGTLLWKYPTTSRIKSDPAVEGGTVFFTSYDKHVYAVTVADGKLVWSFPPPEKADTAAPEPEAKAKAEAPPDTPTPEPAGEAEAPKGEGTAAPAEPPKPAVKPGAFSYSSPAIADGMLFVGNLDRHLYALNIKDGRMAWRFQTGGEVTSTPVVQGGVVYFGSQDKTLYALDTKSGTPKWKFATEGKVMAKIAFDDGKIYFGSFDHHFYCVNAADGKQAWKYRTAGPIISGAAFAQGKVFFGGGRGDHRFYGLDAKTGQEFWKHENRGGRMDADAVVHEGMLYMACGDRNLYSFKINVPDR